MFLLEIEDEEKINNNNNDLKNNNNIDSKNNNKNDKNKSALNVSNNENKDVRFFDSTIRIADQNVSNSPLKNLQQLSKDKKDKEIENLISFKEKKRTTVEIKESERFCYKMICCYKDNRKRKNLKFEFIDLIEKKLDQNFDIIKLFKTSDQTRLLTKLLLNENQCYLLENRELHSIVNSHLMEEIRNLEEIKEKEK